MEQKNSDDERTPGPSMRDQVADQCKVVAALADIIAKVNSDYERLLRDPESGPKMENILDIVGNRTAGLMEYLGDVLNGMDACDEEDEWMTPIFQGAHRMFPAKLETSSLREALAKIEAWEMPPTGKTWPDGGPMSYAVCYGSHGEKDHIRAIARAALNGVTQPSTEVEKISTAANDVLAERERQKAAEGWTLEHDDTHTNFEMGRAAACYAYFATLPDDVREVASLGGSSAIDQVVVLRRMWRWHQDWWKPKDRRRDLVRAGALILAEIERLDRAEVEKISTDEVSDA